MSGETLKYHKAELCRPDRVIALQRGEEMEPVVGMLRRFLDLEVTVTPSTFHVVIDEVHPPQPDEATPATGPTGDQDAVRLLVGYAQPLEIARDRGEPGPDGACRTGDDGPLQADGSVTPPDEGQQVLDTGLDPEACYRYTLTHRSPWTPEEGTASSVTGTVQPADPDRTAPQMLQARREGSTVRVTFDEPVELASGVQGPYLWCSASGPSHQPTQGSSVEGDEVVLAFDQPLDHCSAITLRENGVRDLAGNLIDEQSRGLD